MIAARKFLEDHITALRPQLKAIDVQIENAQKHRAVLLAQITDYESAVQALGSEGTQ